MTIMMHIVCCVCVYVCVCMCYNQHNNHLVIYFYVLECVYLALVTQVLIVYDYEDVRIRMRFLVAWYHVED